MFTANRDAELKLTELAEAIEHEANQWRVMHYHFGQLQEYYRSQYQIKIAVNLLTDLLRENQGGVFILQNFDIVVAAKSASKAQIDKSIFQLRYLFADDPLAYGVEGEENPAFCTIYDLSIQYRQFMDMVNRSMNSKIRKAQEKRETKAGKDSPNTSMESGFTPHMLANIERELEKADVSRIMRHQPICAAVPNMTVRQVYDEFYINIQHLRQMLGTEANFLGNRALFKYLTQILDLKMLDLIRRNAVRYLEKPISLNLNVTTLLSDAFAEFDKAIQPASKVSIVIEIQLEDVFSDMAAFMAAREMVQKMGYRVCLDGLTELTFTLVDRKKLGFDLMKLLWNASSTDEDTGEHNISPELQEAIKRCGVNRVIMCRCDTRDAVDYGQSMGISLFQGRFLDHLIDPTAAVEN
jgi:EAL domain-containing protein (putative c-di-GMP-specific phosphodiesterase class I)